MSTLAFDSLRIQNFRGIKDLRVARLGRVNLIVGKNNSGKTSVLEALHLYSASDKAAELLELLKSRHQASGSTVIDRRRNVVLSPLFHGCEAGPPSGHSEKRPRVVIGPIEQGERTLTIEMSGHVKFGPSILGTRVDGLDFVGRSTFVSATGLEGRQSAAMWDVVALTPLEDDVNRALRLIAPDFERLVFRSIEGESRTRVAFVKLQGRDYPVPLRSLGDGMNRIFGIALAMVRAKGGCFLIDEVENGLHYSIQPDLWRLIFQTARELDVQVFATTHGYDCVRAFEEAARESEEEGLVIRLARKNGQTIVGEFNEQELGIAVEGGIEIR